MLFSPYITTKFYDELDIVFPDSVNNKPLRSLIMYLAFGNWINYYPVAGKSASQNILSIIEGKQDKLLCGRYTAETFLQRAKETILPNLAWSNYKPGFSRIFTNDGFSELFKSCIAFERAQQIGSGVPMVHYLTGNSVSMKKQSVNLRIAKNTKEKLSIADKLNKESGALLDIQKEFLDYLNALPINIFSTILKHNYDAAVIQTCDMPYSDPKRAKTLDMLTAIRAAPKPIYAARKSTVRLFAVGNSITYLPKDIRHVLTKGWIEFDMQNAHLAIIAKDWDIDNLHKVLSDSSIWDYLAQYVDVVANKKALKTALYSLVYGAAKHNIAMDLPGSIGAKFFEIPLIDDIYQARRRQFDQILSDPNHRVDYFGRQLYPGKIENHQARSILAQKAQAVELVLLKPALDLAKKLDPHACLVALYQFDGFSVRVDEPRNAKARARDFCEAIDANARRLGYPTKLTFEIL